MGNSKELEKDNKWPEIFNQIQSSLINYCQNWSEGGCFHAKMQTHSYRSWPLHEHYKR